MRVLHVAHNALPHVGGLETVVAAETHGLRSRGWEVALVTSTTGEPAGERDEGGVRTVRVRAWNGLEARYGVPFPVFSPWLVVVLARQVRRADVVHVHDVLYLSSWVAALWCRVLRTPYVVHRHVGFVHHSSALVRWVQSLVLGTVGRLVLGGAATVLAIDEHVASGLRSGAVDPERVEVLGNGVDTGRFRPSTPEERRASRAAHDLPPDRPLALFVGRFVPKKGFDVVAAAVGDDHDLVFVGGERPAGLDDRRLHFLGSLPPEEMPRVYGCADVMVVASVGECPLTVLESMASGLPVLLNDDPALHSSWTVGPGVEFVDMAGGDLAAALSSLVADPPAMRALGRTGLAFVREAFSWSTHLDQLETAYRRA